MSYNFSLHFSNTYRFQITNKLNYRQLQWLPLFTSHVTIHCLPTPTTTFHQYTSTYPLSDLLSNYQSSMRCPRKQRLLTHHTNYISWCRIHLHYTTTCFLSTFHQQRVQQLLFKRLHFTLPFTKTFSTAAVRVSVNSHPPFYEHMGQSIQKWTK